MGKKFYETQDFKPLEKEWYQKLVTTPDANGETFKDAEDGNNSNEIKSVEISTQSLEANVGLEYAALCETILREYKFKKDIHRIIFEYHTEGKADRDIKAILEFKYGLTFSQQGINAVINTVRENYFKGKQLNANS